MRVVRSIAKYLSDERSDVAEEAWLLTSLTECRPFLLPNYISKDNYSLPDSCLGKTYYLPFKSCSFEMLNPVRASEIDPVGAEAWRSKTGFLDPVFLGQMFVENNDLSVRKIIILFDGTSEKDEFFQNISYVPKRLALYAYEYKNYEELNSDQTCRALLFLINSRATIFGETKGNFVVNKTGRTPAFVKKVVVVGNRGSKSNHNVLGGEKIDWKHQWRVFY